MTLNYAKGCDLVTDDRSGFKEAVDVAKKVMFVLLLSVRQVLLWLVIIVMLLVGKVLI